MAGRLSQHVLESLLTNYARNYRLSQLVSEIIISDVVKEPKVRFTQAVLEVLVLGEAPEPEPEPEPTPTPTTTVSNDTVYRYLLLR